VKITQELKNNIPLHDVSLHVLENSSLIDLFTEQVQKKPTHVAIKTEAKSYTYEALDILSNQLANYLIDAQNVTADTIVAIKLDRDEWLLIAMLAALKTGASYLPIEIESPPEREQFILEDADISVLISSVALGTNINFKGNTCTIDLDFDATQWGNNTINAIKSNDQNAYVIYTSGSTGTPKGTIISHKSLLNYLVWGKKYYLNGLESISFGLFTSIAFDLTVTSLFLPLISGGTLTTYASTIGITQVVENYIKNEHSCIKLTPAHIMVLDALNLKSTALKIAIVGGEVLHQSHVDTLLSINPDMRIFNEYGPTEATVGCVVHEVIAGEEIIIGKPIQNTQAYVLDENNEFVAQGVTGELCISGMGLAKGYLNNPELTAQKFISHPFINDEKLYKTGDLVQWDKNENLHFIGRTDHQVKIRGYRIELGEIEKQIIRKEHIKEVSVVVNESTGKEKQLTAYITASITENIADIRSFLLTKVPDYMVPSIFIQIEKFPLTINGKIDKKKLVETEGNILKSTTPYVAPRNETEEKLVVIWETVLGVEKVGIQDNFFEIGGNSIHAIKLITKIYKELEILLEATNILEGRTIAFISDYIDTIQILEVQEETSENSDSNEKLIF